MIENVSIIILQHIFPVESLSIAVEIFSYPAESLSPTIERLSRMIENLSITIEKHSTATESLSIAAESLSCTPECSFFIEKGLLLRVERASVAVEGGSGAATGSQGWAAHQKRAKIRAKKNGKLHSLPFLEKY